MFKPGGNWKEFGLSSSQAYTVFPFWMFAVVWAVMSFALVNLGSMFVSSIVLKSELASATPVTPVTPVTPAVPTVPTIATPVSQATVLNTVDMGAKAPGYYILEQLATGPRYVYWGPDPPTAANVIVR